MSEPRTVWEGFFEERPQRWRRPHAAVEAWIPELGERGCHRVLDLGCGLGRHLIALGRAGFRVHGLDIATQALDHARSWLQEEGIPARLVRGEMGALPFRDASFDALLSLFVIYHGTRAELAHHLAEVQRVVRPGGLVLVNVIGREHDRYGLGTRLEPDTFAPDVGPDRGVPHHFCDPDTIRTLMPSGLRVRAIEDVRDVEEDGERHQHWFVRAERELERGR